jgi:chromosome segregation protein
MKGFKSFPDRLEIDFEQGITCIVGPNGSGKSNITDAVRWVLGEQKVKNLRGDHMQDVIFNGTKQRKALGYAEVSLIFDNTDQLLPVDYNQVRVTRKLFRSGDSEYAINGHICRLKDIRELFYDTGIGVEGYSIIGQGRIDALLSTNPEERRLIFEEAAGIVKFKTKKNEALKKLEKTNENLTRVTDIVNELKNRIEPLKEQSEKAIIYLELSEKLKRLEINYFMDEVEDLETELKSIHVELQSMGIKIEDSEKSLERYSEHQKHEAEQLHEALSRQQELRDSQILLLTEQKDIENQIARIEERNRYIEDQISRIRMDLRYYQDELKMKEEKLTEVEQKLSMIMNLENDQKSALYALERVVEQERDILKRNRDQHAETNRIQQDKLNLLERFKGESKRYETILSTLDSRYLTVHKEKSNLETQINRLNENIKGQLLKLEALTADQSTWVSRFNEQSHAAGEQKKVIIEMSAELLKCEERRMEKSTKAKVLKELEDNYEGYQYSVKKLFENRQELKQVKLHGVVGDLFKVEAKYEIAVEVALGRSLQNVVVDTEQEANEAINYLKKRAFGRATFMPLSYLELSKDHKQYASADGCIQFESRYAALFDNLLGRTVFVDTMAEALKVFNKHNKKLRVITLEGDVLSPSGTITGGSYQQKNAGLLTRKRELDELLSILVTMDQEIAQLKAHLATEKAKLEAIEVILKDAAYQMDAHKLELLTLKNRLEAEEKEKEYYTTQHTTLLKESGLIAGDKKGAEDEIEKLKLLVQEQEQEGLRLESDYKALEDVIIEQAAKVMNLEKNLTEERIHSAKDEEKVSGLKADQERLKVEVIKLQESIQSCHEQMLQLDSEKGEAQETYVRLEEQLKEQGALVVANEQSLATVQLEAEALEAKRNQTMDLLDKTRHALAGHEHSRTQSEVQKARLESKRESLMEALWSKYEISYMQAMDLREKIKRSEYATTMRKLKVDIRDLGEVNKLAIKEYEEVSGRYTFLSEQQQDLIQAEKTLLEILKDMEQKMKAQFKTKLAEIQENFSVIFAELFGGGSSELVLSNPDNPLEGDIDIVVQPPGKKLQSLNLMSGGEKALTAIALLFSILKTKPSPFCILDEIEAALDDANVDRFADFMKVFTDKSQFVIITHRKGTMEIADSLFGVTMEEFGVSKLLALKLEDYESGGINV